ncbi:MAG: CoA-binding protein [Thermodesulfobacteriota bacterium]|nr:CoA-binding protein [Thermodesulfobacteriota bacterium]
MNDTEKLMEQLNVIFNPESIAIVGVPKGMKAGKLFLMALLDQGFPGIIYPVHPDAEEIDGLKAYPNVSAIPGSVDLAIVLVSQNRTLPVVRECAEKGVRGIVLFTAGYKETGTAEGKEMEMELTRIALSSGMRIIGPNCMGLYAPKTGLAYFPELSQKSGPIGIISHSGSLANILCHMAPEKGLYFSKAVSLGNECDLGFADFLTYLGRDPETKVIGTYIEGIKKGSQFLNALKEASLKKPVVAWKVGLTSEGSSAAFSHTGALSGSREIWEGVISQTGAIPVAGFEAWVDALIGFSFLPSNLGDRMVIISGPGGLAVSAAEACGKVGLRLADLSSETKSLLADFVPPTGTSLKNPIDVGLTASFDIDIYINAAKAVADDSGVDAVVIMGIGLSPEVNKLYADSMVQIHKDSRKPFVIVNIPGLDAKSVRTFFDAGLPFFESAERAMDTYATVRQYQLWRRERSI